MLATAKQCMASGHYKHNFTSNFSLWTTKALLHIKQNTYHILIDIVAICTNHYNAVIRIKIKFMTLTFLCTANTRLSVVFGLSLEGRDVIKWFPYLVKPPRGMEAKRLDVTMNQCHLEANLGPVFNCHFEKNRESSKTYFNSLRPSDAHNASVN